MQCLAASGIPSLRSRGCPRQSVAFPAAAARWMFCASQEVSSCWEDAAHSETASRKTVCIIQTEMPLFLAPDRQSLLGICRRIKPCRRSIKRILSCAGSTVIPCLARPKTDFGIMEFCRRPEITTKSDPSPHISGYRWRHRKNAALIGTSRSGK